jgi:hypothetical protein
LNFRPLIFWRLNIIFKLTFLQFKMEDLSKQNSTRRWNTK